MGIICGKEKEKQFILSCRQLRKRAGERTSITLREDAGNEKDLIKKELEIRGRSRGLGIKREGKEGTQGCQELHWKKDFWAGEKRRPGDPISSTK